jgi:hypothetical protein
VTDTTERGLARGAYAAVTLLLAGAGWVLAVRLGARPGAAVAGLACAWAVQNATFWPLAGALAAGRPAAAPWVAGIAARCLGLAVLWILSLAAGPRGRDWVLTYAFALVAYLLLEAVWLAVATRVAPPGARTQGR